MYISRDSDPTGRQNVLLITALKIKMELVGKILCAGYLFLKIS